MEGLPPFNTKSGGKESLISKPRSTPSSTPIVNDFNLFGPSLGVANPLKVLMLESNH
jgi:hypothetical protein